MIVLGLGIILLLCQNNLFYCLVSGISYVILLKTFDYNYYSKCCIILLWTFYLVINKSHNIYDPYTLPNVNISSLYLIQILIDFILVCSGTYNLIIIYQKSSFKRGIKNQIILLWSFVLFIIFLPIHPYKDILNLLLKSILFEILISGSGLRLPLLTYFIVLLLNNLSVNVIYVFLLLLGIYTDTMIDNQKEILIISPTITTFPLPSSSLPSPSQPTKINVIMNIKTEKNVQSVIFKNELQNNYQTILKPFKQWELLD